MVSTDTQRSSSSTDDFPLASDTRALLLDPLSWVGRVDVLVDCEGPQIADNGLKLRSPSGTEGYCALVATGRRVVVVDVVNVLGAEVVVDLLVEGSHEGRAIAGPVRRAIVLWAREAVADTQFSKSKSSSKSEISTVLLPKTGC